MTKKQFIILTGPTGVGKTALSLELAKALNTEIISADSMQIYKEMDIGTDKISEEAKEGIVHHMLNLITPDREFSVQEYVRQTFKIIEKLNKQGKIPIITGGTNLYINGLIYDLDFNIASPNEHIRSYYEKINEKYGSDFLHGILSSVDPVSADRIHPNQVKRIIRALEVYDIRGIRFSDFNQYSNKHREDIEFKYIFLNRDRAQLYDRINQRVDQMVEEGLLDEAREIWDKYEVSKTANQAIGYKEIIPYLEGKVDLEKAIEDLKRNSRRYAKRQLSWFRRKKNKEEIMIKNQGTDELVNQVLKYIGGLDE